MSARKSPEFQLDLLADDSSLVVSPHPHGQADALRLPVPAGPGTISDHDLAPSATQEVSGSAGTRKCRRIRSKSGPGLPGAPQDLHSAAVSPGIPKRSRGRPPGKRSQKADNAPQPAIPFRQIGDDSGFRAFASNAAPLFLSIRSVARRYEVSPATIWRWVSRGQFPKPRKLAAGTTRWAIADLEAFERTLAYQRSRRSVP